MLLLYLISNIAMILGGYLRIAGVLFFLKNGLIYYLYYNLSYMYSYEVKAYNDENN